MFSHNTAKFSNTLTRSSKALLIALTLVSSSHLIANDEINVDIPTMSDARVFAQFKDKMPAVVNYFTGKTEQEVITFYQLAYGEALQQERKRGRLTLNYSLENNNIRVVISQQNNVRQVDVIVEEDSKK